MRKVVLLSSLYVILACSGLQAQNPNFKTGMTFKKLFMDYQSQNGGEITNFGRYSHGFEIGYTRSLQPRLNLVVPLKVGVVSSHEELNDFQKSVVGIDAQIQYQLYKPESVVIPYFVGGLGGVVEFEGDFNLQAPVGFGLHFKVSDNMFVNYQSEMRFSFSEDRNNLHHGLGFTYLLGPSMEKDSVMEEKIMELDTDQDGVLDKDDKCPQLAGAIELMGCPDTDGDGVADMEDECPDKAGLLAFKGCPDSDGDGIADNEDDCPNLAGIRRNKGCPSKDSDNDGISDDLDNCPDLAGPASNNGCPDNDKDDDGVEDNKDLCPDTPGTAATDGCPDNDGDGIKDSEDKCPDSAGLRVYNGCPDTDNDGIDDSRDKCPNSAGPVSTGGCPEISKEDKQTLDVAMRAVEFDTGKATLKSSSYQILDQISRILGRYPDYNLSIAGHTDNTGKASSNQSLSERRARACYEYLSTKGISINRMSYAGYGESRPIADNNTLSGRSLNRRVEFTLVPR
jgi:OOP family OmpA-OmpF porin